MFKIGEKVVYTGSTNPNPRVEYPKLNEIVTINGYCTEHKGNLDIAEYLVSSINGERQSFQPYMFRKLDHTFAEEVTARIEEEINQEQLVEV
jgi:hypothetical protein